MSYSFNNPFHKLYRAYQDLEFEDTTNTGLGGIPAKKALGLSAVNFGLNKTSEMIQKRRYEKDSRERQQETYFDSFQNTSPYYDAYNPYLNSNGFSDSYANGGSIPMYQQGGSKSKHSTKLYEGDLGRAYAERDERARMIMNQVRQEQQVNNLLGQRLVPQPTVQDSQIQSPYTTLAQFQKGGSIEGNEIPTYFDIENDSIDLPSVVINKGRVHPTLSFGSVDSGFTKGSEALKQFQANSPYYNGEVDGLWGKDTAKAYYGELEDNKQKVFDEAKYQQALLKKKEWQDKINKLGNNVKVGDEFGASKSDKKKAGLGIEGHECIGGVCNFLNSIDQDTFPVNNSYYSNTSFENDASKEGWNQYVGTTLDVPRVGDIVQQKLGKVGRHALLVTDYNEETGDYRLIDNGGGSTAEVRNWSEEHLKSRMNNSDNAWNFFRRDKFGEDSLSAMRKDLNPSHVPTRPDEFNNLQKGNTQSYFKIKEDTQVNAKKKFTKGINKLISSANRKETYSDIPPDDFKKIAVISNTIPIVEYENGKSILGNIEDIAPWIAKVGRGIKNVGKGKSPGLNKNLSVGLSQINPAMLSNRVKKKYFEGKSDNQIERKIRNNKKLQGALTFDIAVDNYRAYKNNPSRYGNNPDDFWYTFMKAHQSPYYASQKKNQAFIKNRDIDYSNVIQSNLKNTTIKYEYGGQLNPSKNNRVMNSLLKQINNSHQPLVRSNGNDYANVVGKTAITTDGTNYGGTHVSSQGYFDNPYAKDYIVPTDGSITMKGVPKPMIGKSMQTGEEKVMLPNSEYFFKNTNTVYEKPLRAIPRFNRK